MRDLPIIFGIFEIGGNLSPILSPRGSTAPRALRKFKIGEQVDLSLFNPSTLKFLKSEVICLRYDLREVLRVPGHLESSKLVFRSILGLSFH